MAYTIGVNKNMAQMFEDLETLMLTEGWTKESRNTIGSFTSSRGYKFTGTADAYPGRYSDTTAIKLGPSQEFNCASISSTPSETFWTDYPTEFSFSFWLNLSECASYWASNGFDYYGGTHLADRPFIGHAITSSVLRKSFDLYLDKDLAYGSAYGSTYGLTYIMDKFFDHKDGKGWELFTITFSNENNLISYYVNDQLIGELPKPDSYATYTYYGVLRYMNGRFQTKILDEIIMWNKVLDLSEVTALYNRTTKVEIEEPYVFEKFTYDIGMLYGGVYKSDTDYGVPIYSTISYTSDNNIALNSYTLFSSDLNHATDPYVTKGVGNVGTSRFLAGVSATSEILKKYWLVVDKNRVIIAYKLLDTTASRTTPLYQLGYLGKVSSLGNDGASLFMAGTTTTSTYLWTTINTSAFRSGVMYSTNNYFRKEAGYANASVNSIHTTLSSLYPVNNATFLAGITVYSGSTVYGSLDGVYALGINQANPEDIITINSVDYVVLPDADAGAGVYYLALKLS